MYIFRTLPVIYKVILVCALGILLCVLGYTVYSYRKNYKQQEGITLITQAQSITNSKERMQRLEAIEGMLPAHMMTGIALQLGNYALSQNDFAQAQQQYARVAQSQQAIRIIGILAEARALMQSAKPLQAIDLLQPITHGLPNDILALVLFTIAEAQENAHLIKDALATYSKIATIDTNSDGYIQYKIQTLTAQL